MKSAPRPSTSGIIRSTVHRAAIACAAAAMLLGSVTLASAPLAAHQSTQPQTPILPPPIGSQVDTPDPMTARQEEMRARQFDSDRHKKMVSDADKLLELATELKVEVDKSTRNETSITAYKKADEIERLAHDVKERLKN